ncbi:MAG: hypothetical protein M3343_08135 [Actinomycetota bacterium]|nr:hypothetical protein [Actinomycetota bacterium]
MSRKGPLLPALLLVFALLAAACGSNSTDDEATGSDREETQSEDATGDDAGADDEETEAEEAEETDDEEGEAATYVGTEFAFEGPDTLPAGATTLELDNQGEQVHELAVAQLLDGKTIDDVNALLKKGVPSKPPKWVKSMEGTGAGPGESGTVDLDLEPGDYVFLCFVPDKESKKPHVALGMIKAVTVE